MKFLYLLALSLLLSGCISMNCSQLTGEHNTVKSDQDNTPTTPITTKLPLLK